jgi:hypothetical protein
VLGLDTEQTRGPSVNFMKQRKQTNKDLNSQKTTMQEVGQQFCKDLGIHRNSEGILLDKVSTDRSACFHAEQENDG